MAYFSVIKVMHYFFLKMSLAEFWAFLQINLVALYINYSLPCNIALGITTAWVSTHPRRDMKIKDID
jgi:ABC-type sulfate transport system permease subunit